jgi:hypothetical protein
MKRLTLLLASLLSINLISCKKDAPEVTDPFLGHWESETYMYYVVDATGKMTPSIEVAHREQMDVTATTIQFTETISGQVYVSQLSYTRDGERLVVDRASQIATQSYVRLLTPDSFTMEKSLLNSTGNTIVTKIPFHR